MFIDELFRCIDAITLIHLPEGPSAYFKLSSFVPSKKLPVSFFLMAIIERYICLNGSVIRMPD